MSNYTSSNLTHVSATSGMVGVLAMKGRFDMDNLRNITPALEL